MVVIFESVGGFEKEEFEGENKKEEFKNVDEEAFLKNVEVDFEVVKAKFGNEKNEGVSFPNIGDFFHEE